MNGYSLPVRATSVKKNSFFVRVMKKEFFYKELEDRNKDRFSLSVQRHQVFSVRGQTRKREGNRPTPAASMPTPAHRLHHPVWRCKRREILADGHQHRGCR
jgi:hypothetical protein